MNQVINIIGQLLRVFCGGNNNNNNQQQQQQQQGYPGQQYPQQQYQQNNQHQAYPPQSAWQQNGNVTSHQGGYNLPPGGVIGPHHPGKMNQDQINATNSQYTNLRNQARHEGDLAHKCFAESQEAYKRGDGARAHELSTEGKQHQAKKEQLDDQAKDWIFRENNSQSPPGTVDLHGLYVKEAIEQTEAAIQQAQSAHQQTLRVIVGKGIHSQGHVAKIKPAVEDLMQKYNLSAHIDPNNAGVLIVDLTGQGSGRSRDAGGIVDDMGKENENCTIM